MNLGVRPRLKNFLFRPKPWVMTPRKIRSFSHLCFLGKTSQKKSSLIFRQEMNSQDFKEELQGTNF